ncbi:MAG: lipid A deacylase LpxR family protein [Candidatus Methylomirabilales bacterium]
MTARPPRPASRRRVAGLLLLGLVVAAPALATGMESAGAPRVSRLWSVGLRWENDTISDNDRFYTNGAVVSLSHTGPSWAEPIFRRLPWGEGRRTVTYSLSQTMFTPEDTERQPADPADRPYAGVLTAGLGLHGDRGHRYDGLKLVLGVVGPWAGAGETQREVHRILKTAVPRGWDSQLHNEPVVNLAYEHRRKYRWLGRAEGWALEGLPIAGAMLGNLITQAQLGIQVRLGYRIPDDFGMTLLRGMSELPPPRHPAAGDTLGFAVHGGVGGNLVLRDLTLDGNTFRDSPSVDKKPFVPLAAVGLSVGSRRFLAAFSYVFAGEEFEGQHGSAQFGTLTFNYFF